MADLSQFMNALPPATTADTDRWLPGTEPATGGVCPTCNGRVWWMELERMDDWQCAECDPVRDDAAGSVRTVAA